MDKLSNFVKENKVVMCICWIVIACLIYLFLAKVFSCPVNAIKIIWIISIALVLYWAIIFTIIYKDSNNKLKWISSITDEFVHMQIFLDNNTLVIEILEGELENLEKLAKVRNYTVERISEHNGLAKVIIK